MTDHPQDRRRIEAAHDVGTDSPGWAAMRARWEAHAARALRRIPGVSIENGGEALFTGRLSPGCAACKRGEWDCVFVTMGCNLDCPFCWRPSEAGPGHVGTALAPDRAGIPGAYTRGHVTGVSFSGGEPFLEPGRLFDWFEWYAARYPSMYYWVYTNGLLVTEAQIERLARLGLHEMRFNLAASGYDNPTALANVAAAAHLLPLATIEIPAIPEDGDTVLSSVARWCEAGARCLNMHELVYEPGTNSFAMAGHRCEGDLGDGHRFAYNPDSRDVILRVMEMTVRQGLPVGVNDCSLHSKFRQLRGRRRLLDRVFDAPGGSVEGAGGAGPKA